MTKELSMDIVCIFETAGNKVLNGARWSSGSAFACRSRGPWFESYTGLT